MYKKYFSNILQPNKLGNTLMFALLFSTLIIWIDYIDLLNYIPLNNEAFKKVFILFLILFITAVIIKFNLKDALRVKFFTSFDSILITAFSILIFLLAAYGLGFPEPIKKRLIIPVLLFVIVVLLCVRVYVVGRISKHKTNKDNRKLIDLKDIYNGKINVNPGEIFYVREDAVSYDLLKRDRIIEQLTSSIIDTSHKGKFVVSLEGKWGSGKTTIINIVKNIIRKEKKDVIIIDNFDPWIYMDQESMFESMFTYILKESNIGFSPLQIKRFVSQLRNSILSSKNINWTLNDNHFNNYAEEIKDYINKYLAKYDKEIIFVIDNIDRAEKENILLIFKLVNHVLDFKGVTYLLSFDSQQVEAIFQEKNIPSGYLEKIIQLEIQIPNADSNILKNVITRTFSNTFSHFGKGTFDYEEYDSLVNLLATHHNDFRNLKRFLNSVLIPTLKDEVDLNLKHKIYIDYIKLTNNSLYNIIFNNKKFFISEHIFLYSDFYLDTIHKEEFNTNGYKFFEDIFSTEKNLLYKDILKDIFPYVCNYTNGEKLISNYNSSNTREIVANKGISSSKYFDLYFTLTTNLFSKVSRRVDLVIDKLTVNQSIEDVHAMFEPIHELSSDFQKEFFELFNLRMIKISKENNAKCIIVLFSLINKFSNRNYLLSISSRRRISIIIAELLKELPQTEIKDILVQWKYSFNKLLNISNVITSLKSNREGDATSIKAFQMLNQLYETMVSNILKNNINLYHDKHYSKKNIFGLYRGLNIQDKGEEFKLYMNNVVSENNIFRVLLDLMQFTTGTNNSYSFEKQTIISFGIENKIDDILNRTLVQTADEKFILEVYNAYKENSDGYFLDDGIIVERELDLDV